MDQNYTLKCPRCDMYCAVYNRTAERCETCNLTIWRKGNTKRLYTFSTGKYDINVRVDGSYIGFMSEFKYIPKQLSAKIDDAGIEKLLILMG